MGEVEAFANTLESHNGFLLYEVGVKVVTVAAALRLLAERVESHNERTT